MHHIPDLARANKEATSDFVAVYRSFRRILLWLLLLIAVALLPIATIGGPLFFPEAISLEHAWLIFMLLLANTVVGQMGVPDSSRLMVKEQGRLMMRINGAAFALFGVLIGALCLMPSDASNLVLLLVGQVAISGMRCVWLNVHARRMQYGCFAETAT
jgi:O-antigen/teichoic acid export membrane protein